jgi:aminoglycoside phosphotransferase (APT) family kinase protein
MEIDQPVAVRQGEELDLKALNNFLSGRIAIGPVLAQKQFPGGYSNLTYLITTAQKEYILRRPPFGAAIKSAHDMGREFRVLSAVKPHYEKVPQPVILCEDLTVLNAPFYIMEKISGVILRPSMAKEIHVTPARMKEISESLIDNLAHLHSVNIKKSGLDQLGKPEGYIQRQVEGWGKRYLNAQTDKIDSLDSVIQWLSAHMPAETTPVLLHNDYKYDNLVLDANNMNTIVGVLDWEMATIGDPWMDVGASLAYWAEAGDDALAKVFNLSWLTGNLTRQEFVERYTMKSGRSANPVFYYVFGLYKNAVIAQQIYARWKQGHSKDPRFGQLIHVINNLGQRAVAAIEKDSI